MAKNKNDKGFNLNVAPEEVMFTGISTSKDGYSSARIVAQRGENQYLSISYEWQGGGIPDFAMDLVDFMKANNVETSGIWANKEEAYKEFSNIDK
jgi:hypothetical protein